MPHWVHAVEDASLDVLPDGPDKTKLVYHRGEAGDLPIYQARQPEPTAARSCRGGSSRCSRPSQPQPLRARERPARAGRGALHRGAAAGGPRHRQPRLGASLRRGPGAHAQRLRPPGRAALASGVARRPGPRASSAAAGRSSGCTGRSCCRRHIGRLRARQRRKSEVRAADSTLDSEFRTPRSEFDRSRQSSAVAHEPPPAGRRGVARRLLAASGELDLAIGGPPHDLVAARETAAARSMAKIGREDQDNLLLLYDFPTRPATAPAASRPRRRCSSCSCSTARSLRQQATALAERIGPPASADANSDGKCQPAVSRALGPAAKRARKSTWPGEFLVAGEASRSCTMKLGPQYVHAVLGLQRIHVRRSEVDLNRGLR